MKIKTYAKINLYLDVIGKYPDGYHEIESIFQTVSLADTLTFQEIPKGIVITTNSESLPVDEKNIVYKTAKKIQDIAKIKKGVHVHIDKNIPIGAGLGGGSANSAGTIFALNKLWGLNWNEIEQSNIAIKIGADVPYFLKGGTQAVTGKGEKLTQISTIPDIWIVLIHPPFSLSTASVYRHPTLKIRLHMRKKNHYTLSFRKAIIALQKCEWNKVIYNRLEIPSFSMHPELHEVKKKIKKMGFPFVGMTGSGSTLFVIVESKQEGEKLISHLNWKSHIVKTTPVAIEEIKKEEQL